MLRFVLDEQLRGPLWKAIRGHNARGLFPIDAVRVGNPPGLPTGTNDPDILLWAEQEGRILVSADRKTLPGHLTTFLQAGHQSPGIFAIRRGAPLDSIVDYLAMAAHGSEPYEWQDRIEYIP